MNITRSYLRIVRVSAVLASSATLSAELARSVLVLSELFLHLVSCLLCY